MWVFPPWGAGVGCGLCLCDFGTKFIPFDPKINMNGCAVVAILHIDILML